MAFRIDLSVTSYAEIERAQVHTNLEFSTTSVGQQVYLLHNC
nr:hypothetical protein [Anaerotruncus colihominis]